MEDVPEKNEQWTIPEKFQENLEGNPILVDTQEKVATKGLAFIEYIKNIDPKSGNIFKRMFKKWARYTFLNPEDVGKTTKYSQNATNIFSKGLRKLIPETRNKKIAAQLLILAGLVTGLAYLIKLHQTHHIIPKEKKHEHYKEKKHYKEI